MLLSQTAKSVKPPSKTSTAPIATEDPPVFEKPKIVLVAEVGAETAGEEAETAMVAIVEEVDIAMIAVAVIARNYQKGISPLLPLSSSPL